jgi:hypothetical protein
MAALPILNMLWVEGRLGALERACIRSVLRQGHRLVLWSYGKLEGAPEGVELRDGRAVIPAERLLRHVPTGSWSLFSNLFRYRMLQMGLGVWLDSDMYLLRPIELGDRHIYGFQDTDQIAAGIIALPSSSPVLTDLLSYFDAVAIPPWLPWRWKLRYAAQRALRGRYLIETMPWGNLGPRALHAMLVRHGLEHRARPRIEFYPWTWQEAGWIFDPAHRLADWIAPETRAVHLFNQVIRDRKDQPAAPGSFMAQLQAEGA